MAGISGFASDIRGFRVHFGNSIDTIGLLTDVLIYFT
jgi:hypothetical protein